MATIADVARAAGVSVSTVSYVLSGKRSISPATRERVQNSIDALGFRPNAGARALASSRTNVLSLVVPLRTEIIVPVIMQFATAVVTTARRYDHDVLLHTQDEGPEGLRRVSRSAMVDAFIVMDVEADDPRVPVLTSLPQPAVLIGVPQRPSGLSCVDLDFAGAGALAAQHLLDHGHRRIALVGPAPAVFERGTSYARRVVEGFTEAAAGAGAAAVVEPCEPTFEGVEQCLDAIAAGLPGVTGYVIHNEVVIGLVLASLRARGVDVPGDASVVAICPEDVALSHPVKLTSVPLPAAEIGAIAVEMVMQRLETPRGAETRLLAPTVTERDSCAPPPVRAAATG